MAQAVFVLIFGLVIGIPFTVPIIIGMLVVALLVCLLGGAFGLILLASFGSQRAANQILPFLIFPQFFLAGVFTPLAHGSQPLYLDIISRITPLRYAVDLTRNVYYAGTPQYGRIVSDNPLVDIAVMALLFGIFLIIGTFVFVRSERNR